MQTIEKKSTKKAWAGALAQPASEFPLTPLPVIAGKIPEGLRGTLYRNGPGRLERGEMRVGHWFDGDGAILAVHFTDAGAKGVYRYVQTEEYKAESIANKYLYAGFGYNNLEMAWKTLNQQIKNPANISVLALPDKLLALWDASCPYALDLQTLETKGLDYLGALTKNLPYSAHYKRDPLTGEIYNFGVSVLGGIKLNLYRSDRTGKIIQKNAFPLDRYSIIHDFVITNRYLIFFIPPLKLKLLPVLFGLSDFSRSFDWKPNLGTQILIFDRQTLSLVSRGETDPWFYWHFGNAGENPDGSISLDVVRYADFDQTNEFLREVPTGETQTVAKGTLWQMQINPQTAKVITQEEVVSRKCEFPVVAQSQVGQPWRYTYFSLIGENVDIKQELFGAIARFDYQTHTLTEADLGKNRYGTEPIHAQDKHNTEQGWLLTVVYDGNTHSSEVWIYDSDRLKDEPVCKLELPNVIPHGYHGTWKPA
ncbi:MAG TPA: carotenoid oxygenase family protein [Nostocaceae cyanobacterium]|nr:carotenoid oxygenase family protein [Nostocaceae cyanobacterium]